MQLSIRTLYKLLHSHKTIVQILLYSGAILPILCPSTTILLNQDGSMKSKMDVAADMLL